MEGVQYINDAVYYVIQVVKYVLYMIALVYIVIAGLKIVTAGGDDAIIKSNKDTIVYALFGFVVILLADTIVKNVFYGGDGSVGVDPGACLLNSAECTAQGRKELLGLVQWGKSLLAIIAVIEIVVSGIRMILAIGEEDAITKEKKVFVWVGIGLLILAVDTAIIDKVLYVSDGLDPDKENALKYAPNLKQGVSEFVGVIQFVLRFVGVFAIASIVYAGFLMIVDFGDSERVGKARTILKDAIIGLIIVSLSYVLIATIALP